MISLLKKRSKCKISVKNSPTLTDDFKKNREKNRYESLNSERIAQNVGKRAQNGIQYRLIIPNSPI